MIEAQSSDCVVFLNLMSSVGGVMIAIALDDKINKLEVETMRENEVVRTLMGLGI